MKNKTEAEGQKADSTAAHHHRLPDPLREKPTLLPPLDPPEPDSLPAACPPSKSSGGRAPPPPTLPPSPEDPSLLPSPRRHHLLSCARLPPYPFSPPSGRGRASPLGRRCLLSSGGGEGAATRPPTPPSDLARVSCHLLYCWRVRRKGDGTGRRGSEWERDRRVRGGNGGGEMRR